MTACVAQLSATNQAGSYHEILWKNPSLKVILDFIERVLCLS